ncbi:MAG: GNAT family N-acetyltransferase [Chloroflexi bacterium]|nr:MAG: GNAT family N-acetyltransferase [Chloroflexota bacterium]TMD79012.1 MAG: GNAT family N-acetyltransferase [Chloroflexota bacterium]
MTISIRPATPNDVPTVAFLIRALSQYEKLEHEVTMTEDRLRATMFGPRPYAEALLAEDDGKPVGFALFFHNYSTFLAQPGLYLEDLYVPESHRGKGIGKSLLVQLAKIAVERNCGRLEWAVLDWNVDAIGFYEKLGAKPNSEWTVYRLTGDSLNSLAGQ